MSTLVINLDKDTDRMCSISKQLNGLQDFSVRRIPGVLGSSLPNYAVEMLAGEHHCPAGTLGCFLAHVNAWEHIARDQRWTLVLEDDVNLLNPEMLFRAEIPCDADLVFVNESCDPRPGCIHNHAHPKVIPTIELLRSKALLGRNKPDGTKGHLAGGYAYLLSGNGAQKLIRAIEKDNYITGQDGLMLRYSLCRDETRSIVKNTWLDSVARGIVSPDAKVSCSWNVIKGYCLSPAAARESDHFLSVRVCENQDEPWHVRRASRLMAKANYDKAAQILLEGLRRFPQSVELRELLEELKQN